MSWSEFLPSSRRRILPLALLGVMAAGLGGCFTPMYASVGGNLGGELRAIKVDPVPDRLGHYLQDELITRLNGTGGTVPAKYRLTLTTSERVQTALIDIVTQRAQDAALTTDVSYRLTSNDGKLILSGTAISAAVYDRSAQRYANIRAARDAEIRDAKTVADQITTQIAAKLGGL
jgi:LPS-assembly lipoprotein